MKRKFLFSPLLIFLLLILGSSAYALSLSYEFGEVTYGTMDITAKDTDTLTIRYDANSPLPGSAEVTGFGFTFNPNTILPSNVDNPHDGDITGDLNGLDWIELDNLNAIPNPANSSLLKTDFLYGVTEGNSNNINPPGIRAGEFDVFYLDFTGVQNLVTLDLASFVQYTGIRIQSLPDDINGGSLFLTDTPNPVPEPTTMLLFGTGLIGLAGFGRKKFKKN